MELIVVVGVMAILSIAAIAGLIKSQDQFKFRGAIKDSTNIIREIRTYALSNKQVQDSGKMVVPLEYGAYIDTTKNLITIFGDMIDKSTPGNEGKFNYDVTKASNDVILNTYQAPTGYKLATYNGTTQTTGNKPMTVFYQPTTGEFSILETLIFTERFAAIEIYQGNITSPDRQSFIVLFKVSGNPETFGSLQELTEN